MPEDVTPIRKQYLEIKRDYPGAILFFRLGDFYETFDEDAEITARELDIVLTSRPIGKGVRAPLAGIPYHSIDNYLSRLIQKGYHVAICEQIGEEPVEGIFPRKVVRVVTPGTIIEPGLLPGDSNNFLASVVLAEANIGPRVSTSPLAGVAYVDITTGEFAATELAADSLQAELARLRPAEVIHPDNQRVDPAQASHPTSLPSWRFEPGKCEAALLAHFRAGTLEGFGLKGRPLAARAAGAILQYLELTQPDALGLLAGLRFYSLGEFMTLDSPTRRNLELDQTLRGERRGSLLGLLDRTITPMGRRLIHKWVSQPLLDESKIRQRQDNVKFFVDDGLQRAELRAALGPLVDLERLVNRIVAGHAQPRGLVELRATLERLPAIAELLRKAPKRPPRPEAQATDADNVGEEVKESGVDFGELPSFESELRLLRAAVTEEPPSTTEGTGIIRSGYSKELDSVVSASQHARDWIAKLETSERARTGIKSLKVGYNKVFGYYIEISRGAADKAPENYIRKQTLVNAERFITPEVKEYETLVLNAEARIHEIESRLFGEVCASLSRSAARILLAARTLAELDVVLSLAEVAALSGYIRPEVVAGPILDIRGGRHPVVEQSLQRHQYVPNDAAFENGEIVRIITGPNMSGKSTYLRQVALIVLMAQMGSFVPAESARIGLVDRIFTRIGAQDDIHSGQSTFMVEMIEAANILHHATPRSLLILDEIGRGTSTYDGVSIAWAVVEFIHNHPHLRAKTVFATHYHELTQLADLLPGVRNYNVAVTEADGNVVFLHKIVAGGADKSYGIHVAQLAGLPGPVVQRANEILEELEKSSGRAVRISPHAAQQAALFPETSPLLEELAAVDENSLSPIEALTKLFEWKKKYLK
jgi:DNA mismatch repair protein MutS